MGEQIARDMLAEGLLETFDEHSSEISEQVRMIADWLRSAAEPPPGVVLHSNDGTEFSGLAIVERNRVIALLAIPHPPITSPPIVTPPPRQPEQRHELFRERDEHEPSWRHDGVYQR
ncbi:MAG: hypothetical protein HRU16_08480 [Planctomycetes bacterium]|nr:hypothetical protein [Planctomycetota bacterium]